jgi:large subunit ribosomal protein L6
MSRIGRLPVPIPKGVDVRLSESAIEVKGPKGLLSMAIPPLVTLSQGDGNVVVKREGEDGKSKAMHGLARALINNMVLGVTEGFRKQLEIQGVGYRATLQGNALSLELGFSHPIAYPIPEGIQITVERSIISVQGIDKEKVGQTAAEIRAFRKPEPYKGKGVRYVGERVRTKVGKRNA